MRIIFIGLLPTPTRDVSSKIDYINSDIDRISKWGLRNVVFNATNTQYTTFSFQLL